MILHKTTKGCLKLSLSAKVNLQRVFLQSLCFGKFGNDFAQKYQRLFETFLVFKEYSFSHYVLVNLDMILYKNTKGYLKLSLSAKVSSKITCIRNIIQILKGKKQKKGIDFYKNKNVV